MSIAKRQPAPSGNDQRVSGHACLMNNLPVAIDRLRLMPGPDGVKPGIYFPYPRFSSGLISAGVSRFMPAPSTNLKAFLFSFPALTGFARQTNLFIDSAAC